MLNFKYRKSGNIFIWKPEFIFQLQIRLYMIKGQSDEYRQYSGSTWAAPGQHPGSTLAVPGQYSGSTRAVMCLYRIKYDRIKCDRIKYAFTGSYVFLQDHMCMLPDQVWPDQVWPDQMCFTWNLIHCIAILIYNFAIRLYPLVLEFCLYIYGYLQKEVGSLGAGFSLLTLERCIV
jgi:hypothetical protein